MVKKKERKDTSYIEWKYKSAQVVTGMGQKCPCRQYRVTGLNFSQVRENKRCKTIHEVWSEVQKYP